MSELRLVVAAAAQRDIESIGRFIALDSPASARAFVDRLTQSFERLRAMPGIGTSRAELEPGLLGRAFGNYIIYYRVIDGNLLVQRVVHGARDQHSAFLQSPETDQ